MMFLKAVLLAGRNTPASPPPPPPPPPPPAALVVSANPTLAYGEVTTSNATAVVTSWAVNLSISGGVAPYSVSWAYQSGEVLQVLTPGITGTRFRETVWQQTMKEAVYRATVTDAALTTATIDVPVQLVCFGDYTGGLAVLF